MKILLIIFLGIISYTILLVITGLLHAALFGYIEVGEDEQFSSVFIGSVWPISLPIMIIIVIGGVIVSSLDTVLEYIVKRFNKKKE